MHLMALFISTNEWHSLHYQSFVSIIPTTSTFDFYLTILSFHFPKSHQYGIEGDHTVSCYCNMLPFICCAIVICK